MAAGVNRRPLYPGYRPGLKALVELHQRPLLSYVVEALAGFELGVVGDEERLRPLTGPCRFAPGSNRLVESLVTALRMFPEDPMILLVPADLPMLRRELVDDFLQRCQASKPADLYLAMVPEGTFRPPYDRVKKYMSHFKDGVMCHGNLALLSPAILRNENVWEYIEPIYEQRLSPIRSALTLGPGLGLMYLLGVHLFHRLKLETFARLASRHFGLKLRPVVCPHPELAVDIDEAADYEVACAALT